MNDDSLLNGKTTKVMAMMREQLCAVEGELAALTVKRRRLKLMLESLSTGESRERGRPRGSHDVASVSAVAIRQLRTHGPMTRRELVRATIQHNGYTRFTVESQMSRLKRSGNFLVQKDGRWAAPIQKEKRP